MHETAADNAKSGEVDRRARHRQQQGVLPDHGRRRSRTAYRLHRLRSSAHARHQGRRRASIPSRPSGPRARPWRRPSAWPASRSERVFIAVTCGRLKSANLHRTRDAEPIASSGAPTSPACMPAAEAFVERGGRAIVQIDACAAGASTRETVTRRSARHGRQRAVVADACRDGRRAAAAQPAARGRALLPGDGGRDRGTLRQRPGRDDGGGAAAGRAVHRLRRRHDDACRVRWTGSSCTPTACPVGGSHISFDIARELVDASCGSRANQDAVWHACSGRLRRARGDLVSRRRGERWRVLRDDQGAAQRRSSRPRMETIYGLVAEKVAASRLEHLAAGPIVLTGGAGQMMGLAEWWSSRSGVTTRIGRPRPVGGMAANMCSPLFAAAAGLVLAALSPDAASSAGVAGAGRRTAAGAGYFGRLRGWVRESF